MIELWVVLAVAAAFFQNLRSALQKHLKGKLSNSAAAYSRFLYALPFSLIYLVVMLHLTDRSVPELHSGFLLYAFAGSVAQILFTVTLLWMFSFKSFAVGTTLSKLEVVVVALLGVILLQDKLSAIAVIAICICVSGVIALSKGQTGIRISKTPTNTFSRDTTVSLITGLGCAFFLGASVVCFRGASLSLESDSFIIKAATTLFVSLFMQTILMGIWITLREREQWTKLIQQWRWASVVGIAGTLASIAWFTAFTLQNASFVRAVGTIELLFTYLFSTRVFREKVSRAETVGVFLIAAGIILLLAMGD